MTTYQIGTTALNMVEAETVFGTQPSSTYQPGERLDTYSGEVSYLGYPRSIWRFAGVLVTDWASLRSSYLGSNYSGEVYVQTRDDTDVWATYRATLKLPDPASLQRWSDYYIDVDVELVLLEEEA